MDHLKELADTRQVPGEPHRRWFHSPELDLIVWFGESDTPIGFQLCYDKSRGERALTWRTGRGYDHSAVDDGNAMPARHKGSPILVADGAFDHRRVKAEFMAASAELPEALRSFVGSVLDNYPRG